MSGPKPLQADESSSSATHLAGARDSLFGVNGRGKKRTHEEAFSAVDDKGESSKVRRVSRTVTENDALIGIAGARHMAKQFERNSKESEGGGVYYLRGIVEACSNCESAITGDVAVKDSQQEPQAPGLRGG